VCAIIDSFHFKVDLEDDPAAAAAPKAVVALPQLPFAASAEATAGGEESGEGATAGERSAVVEGVSDDTEKPEAASGREILGALTKRVLPVLQSVLVRPPSSVPATPGDFRTG
jgi:hypothetical protein